MLQNHETGATSNPEELLMDFFHQHSGTMLALVRSGLFEMKNGSVTIHFDHQGNVRKIESQKVMFRS